MLLRGLSFFIGLVLLAGLRAQVNVPVNGPREATGRTTAFIHATLHPAPGEVVRDGTVVITDGRIVSVGGRVEVPAGALVIDLHGLHLWPALVEPYATFGGRERGNPAPKETAPKGAHFWNPAIRASTRTDLLYEADAEKQKAMRAQGFGTMVLHRADGIARGTSSAVLLGDRSAREDLLVPRASANFSFRKGSSTEEYPSSLMGSIALLRQTFYDQRWYAAQGRQQQSDAELEALGEQLDLPLVFEASDRSDALRIAAIGKEFGLSFIVKGNGDEYARLADVLAPGKPLIIPAALPQAYDVEDPFDALEVGLAKLKHWELAPTNAARIHAAGGTFAFTTQGLGDPAELWANLRRMVRCGLDTATAIAALTTVPAEIYRLGDRVGRIAPGSFANLVITSEHLLHPKNRVLETWVAGRPFTFERYDEDAITGTYELNTSGLLLRMRVKADGRTPEVYFSAIGEDTTEVKGSIERADASVNFWFEGRRFGRPGAHRFSGSIHEGGAIWDGQGQLPGGSWVAWSAVRRAEEKRRNGQGRDKDAERAALDSLWSAPTGEVWYPMSGYGRSMLPDTEIVVFRHATVWTNGPQGVLRDTDVLISGGRIVAIGSGLNVTMLLDKKRRTPVVEIDATGKHLTCGIIDEHSHIAIARGVNEGSQAITAEVRIGDVIDPEDVDIYRDLAGGVTAVQQLHGSANPIGGQSSLIKLRWGQNAEQMRINGAEGFIKFALGENVKQSNWGNDGTRFPQTRMGVEQVMYDAFTRAREYRALWRAYAESRPQVAPVRGRGRRAAPAPTVASDAPRRDLELEALTEILDDTRHITCHSYVQSEINMLMHVADSMGFKVNTFTHILEGYKLARELKAHGASASSFSDWWAYKLEVNDAIPHNAALLNAQGVNTCINSDDAEMSRRLNQEAAKAVKYGGAAPEDAWKMVTLNPAKALHLDARMGSVEVGKDADVVLWSADPLSIEARAELVFVDGVRRFDKRQDEQQRVVLMEERERIVAKMIAAKKAGAPVRKAERKEHREWQCETIGEEP